MPSQLTPSNQEEIKNKTQPPFEQFEECQRTTCVYRNANGRCIYETCIFTNEKPQFVDHWDFECQSCHKIEQRDVRDMKIMFCDSCLARIRKAEELPFHCVFCGKSQGHPSKIMFSGICDECFAKLKRSIHCKNCGNS